MPNKRKPSYWLHKPTGQARVRIDGKDIYLGEYGSQESRDRYDALILDWLTNHGDITPQTLCVDDLALLYMEHAENYYVKNGKHTSEVHKSRSLLRLVVELHGRTRVQEFGPNALRGIQTVMLERNWIRNSINEATHRIRKIFRWGASRELLPVSVVQALETVEGVKKGRTKARESKPILPVDDLTVEATLSFLPQVVADMVLLQRLTGMRPGECCAIRPCDVTFGTDGVWVYRPENHKSEHHNKERAIFIGPKAQAILRPYLDRDSDSYCFSPLESEAGRNADRKANRKSPMTPSQRGREQTPKPKRSAKDHYNKDSYRRAITRACELAFGMPEQLRNIPKALKAVSESDQEAERERLKELAKQWREEYCWSPNQLRHTAATIIRATAGIETARTVLGHSSTDVTEIYAERDNEAARAVMFKIG